MSDTFHVCRELFIDLNKYFVGAVYIIHTTGESVESVVFLKGPKRGKRCSINACRAYCVSRYNGMFQLDNCLTRIVCSCY